MIVFKKSWIYVGKHEFLHLNLVVFFPLQLHIEIKESWFKQEILASKRVHTRGNPNPKTLHVVEDTKRILRKGKAKRQEGTS